MYEGESGFVRGRQVEKFGVDNFAGQAHALIAFCVETVQLLEARAPGADRCWRRFGSGIPESKGKELHEKSLL